MRRQKTEDRRQKYLGLYVLAFAFLTMPAFAQTRPTTQPDSSIDAWLDRLDARGKNLDNFAADLRLTETDNSTMLSTTRLGTVVFQRPKEGDARMKITFDKKIADENGPPLNEKIEYVLKDGWLIERDYRLKKQISRQVVRPGEKINLLKLGEGPFPLPIGQDKQKVHKQFDVKIIPPAKDDPADSAIHLQLIPKRGSQFERKFGSIDVWVDAKTDMPIRIEAVDRNGTTTRTTDLDHLKVNATLGASAFDLPSLPEGWERYEEPYGG
jgi:outer membrane lipoprotein-sorting protein